MDDSLMGWVGVPDNLSVQGTWSLQKRLLPIILLELMVICLALLQWSVHLKGLPVRVQSVRQEKFGRFKRKLLLSYLGWNFMFPLCRLSTIQALKIGRWTFLSPQQLTSGELALHPEVFEEL